MRRVRRRWRARLHGSCGLHDPTAGVDDGSCDFCSCSGDSTDVIQSAYPLIVEASPSVQAGLTVYRFYVQLENETDRMSAIFGDDQVALQVRHQRGHSTAP